MGQRRRALTGAIATALWVSTEACTSGRSEGAPSPSTEAGAGDDADSSTAGVLPFGVTPGAAEAFAGVCDFALLDLDAAACTGIDAFVACAQAMCGLEACATGECIDYTACLVNSGDFCGSSCTPPLGCGCRSMVVSCASQRCLDAVACGPVVEGGPCDTLDMCCASQTPPFQDSCRSAAVAARVQGDPGCRMVLSALPRDSGLLDGCDVGSEP